MKTFQNHISTLQIIWLSNLKFLSTTTPWSYTAENTFRLDNVRLIYTSMMTILKTLHCVEFIVNCHVLAQTLLYLKPQLNHMNIDTPSNHSYVYTFKSSCKYSSRLLPVDLRLIKPCRLLLINDYLKDNTPIRNWLCVSWPCSQWKSAK